MYVYERRSGEGVYYKKVVYWSHLWSLWYAKIGLLAETGRGNYRLERVVGVASGWVELVRQRRTLQADY